MLDDIFAAFKLTRKKPEIEIEEVTESDSDY